MADKLKVALFLLLFVSFRPVITEEAIDQEALIFNNVKNQHNSDLSPAFKPGSYVQNAVDTSIKEKSSHGAHSHIEEPAVNEDIEDDQAPAAESAESKGGFFSEMISELKELYEEGLDYSDSETPSAEEEAKDGESEDQNDEADKPKTTEHENGLSELSDEELEHLRVKSKSEKENNRPDSPKEEEELIEEDERKVLTEKEKRIDEEGERKREEDEANQIKIESLKQQTEDHLDNKKMDEIGKQENKETISKSKQVETNEEKEEENNSNLKEEASQRQAEEVRQIRLDSLKPQPKEVEENENEEEENNQNVMVEEKESSQGQEEEAGQKGLDSLKQQPKEVEENENKKEENNQNIMVEKEESSQGQEEEAGQIGLDSLKQQPKEVEENEKKKEENNQYVMVEKEESSQRQQEEAGQIGLDSLKSQPKQVEENEKKKKEAMKHLMLEKEESSQGQEEEADQIGLDSLKPQPKEVKENEKKKKENNQNIMVEKDESSQGQEEEADQIGLDSLKPQPKEVEENEKKKKENNQNIMVEKEESSQIQEEEAMQIRLDSLKQQLKQVKESEKKEEEKLLRERIQKQRESSLKEENGVKRKEGTAMKSAERVVPLSDNVQEKEKAPKVEVIPSQKNGKQSKDRDEEEEHIRLKGAFDQKLAKEEAALKRKLEKLNEERRNFEKMAEEYRLSKQQRLEKQQQEKHPASQHPTAEPRTSVAGSMVQGKSEATTQHGRRPQSTRQTPNTQRSQELPRKVVARNGEKTASLATDAAKARTQTGTTHTVGVSGTKTGTTRGGVSTAVSGTPFGADRAAEKKAGTKKESTTNEPFQRTVKDDEVPVHSDSKVEAQPTATTTGTTTTVTKHESEHSSEGKDQIPMDTASCHDGFCHVKPEVISLASRFQKVERKSTVGLVEPQFNDNASQVKDTHSRYAAFMREFRNFHEASFQLVLSYWPAAKNKTRNLLSYVRLDGIFEQLCNDLADVHPAVLLTTFVFGTLGILYFFWSITFGRMQGGARGPNPRDVLRSYEARARILEEEVESLKAEKLKIEMDRNNTYKEKRISDEQLRKTNATIENLTKAVEKMKKEKEDFQSLIKEVNDSRTALMTENKEKGDQIAGCENMISTLKTKIEAQKQEIQKISTLKTEIEAKSKETQEISNLKTAEIEAKEEEIHKLENLLTEVKEKKQNLQVEFDNQLLRLSDLQQQFEFKCNEVEVLKDCLKQIKLQDSEEEPGEEEMAERLQNLMKFQEVKEENEKLQEKVKQLEMEAEELRKTKKVLEEDNAEKTERLEQAESKASQATLTKREKEIELEALQKYFKSSEVELHRKITAEESTRISIENQLQSEQAKASTAVVDADKYRQLYLDIKKQIEEIDESKKEQLSNMEKKAHQNWLDYRAAVREVEGLKDENEILRRKLYDLEVRGSRPSSSASSQLNHVDGRDSPSRRSPMSVIPGHGSPVPFVAPPMMGPLPPPPPSMFPGQRRPHPADILGMTPPRPPFPPPGPATRGHATPPPTTAASTTQSSSNTDGRADSFDSKDGSPHPPPHRPPPPPMSGYGPPPPIPPMMRMPRFPPPPMMPPPPNGPLPPPMFLPRPGGPMPLPPQGPRPQGSSTPSRS